MRWKIYSTLINFLSFFEEKSKFSSLFWCSCPQRICKSCYRWVVKYPVHTSELFFCFEEVLYVFRRTHVIKNRTFRPQLVLYISKADIRLSNRNWKTSIQHILQQYWSENNVASRWKNIKCGSHFSFGTLAMTDPSDSSLKTDSLTEQKFRECIVLGNIDRQKLRLILCDTKSRGVLACFNCTSIERQLYIRSLRKRYAWISIGHDSAAQIRRMKETLVDISSLCWCY